MRLTSGLPLDDLRKVPSAVRAIEEAGYDGVDTQENRHDPFLPLAVAAVNSEKLQLTTGISIAFARSPMVFANLGWDLQRASRGRFMLGLGSQVKGHNERRFSVPWSAPAPRMRECVQAVRTIWNTWKTGEPLNFAGEHYRITLMPPNYFPEPLESATPPIVIAAVGPVMMTVAGQVCDGLRLHPFSTRKYLENVALPRLQQAVASRGGSRASFEVAGGGFVAAGPDPGYPAHTHSVSRFLSLSGQPARVPDAMRARHVSNDDILYASRSDEICERIGYEHASESGARANCLR